eukprot:TRINITY_DN48112_c0_g2_i1.p1 TRINITY_DN48112_c0_g2~~TRINITY_DN48112_c0_g2_i1.p1  ORF type:complete len:362 (+),score=84.88 TRINITY_DN48112_c0_g2_i1:50-1135(+)
MGSTGVCDMSAAVPWIVVGCGCPKRGMGWYHAMQLLQLPEVDLRAVVEPWYLSAAGLDSLGSKEFMAFKEELENKGITVVQSVCQLPKLERPWCTLIATRAADTPKLFNEVVEAGCSHIYLEKPGAASTEALEQMRDVAKGRGAKVYMGYNKNVAKYVSEALECQRKLPAATTLFFHNNTYTDEELPACFEKNAEGMMKNMAIHELALAVTFHGVTSTNIDTVVADKEFSEVRTLGPFTDFVRIGFTVKTTSGSTLTIRADRCGGNNSGAVVYDATGKEALRVMAPDPDRAAWVRQRQAEDPEMMPYFFLQSEEYLILKSRLNTAIKNGGEPEGAATIDIAVEALKVAEYLTPVLQKQLGN